MKKIKIGQQEKECFVQKRKNAKRMTLSVRADAKVMMTIPRWATYGQAKKFLEEKKGWIVKKINVAKKKNPQDLLTQGSRKDYEKRKELAREIVLQKLEHFNSFYRFKYKRVSIRNQRTRWGSCSGQGNLNFNYRIIYLTDRLSDYLVVHELCHLKHLDHSKKFWNCVASAIPDHKKLSKTLRKI